MVKQIFDVCVGDFYWIILKLKDHINYNKVVLFLTGDNIEVDKYALQYLDLVIERKQAKEAIIYILDKSMQNQINMNFKHKIKIKYIKRDKAELIYKRYCIDKFFKNIFWTYTHHTKNNLLGRFMVETEINAEDVVCLAIYNFRKIPKGWKTENVCS